MRQVRVVLTCDEGFVADSLREAATAYEDNSGDFFEVEHGSGFMEFLPEPSLADIFDEKKDKVIAKREHAWVMAQKMNEEERAWIEQMLPKLEFLKERGFTVKTYFGGIKNGFPHNGIRISAGGTLWVEIEGSTVRRTDGTINHLSPHIANTEVLTLEDLIKKIAEW